MHISIINEEVNLQRKKKRLEKYINFKFKGFLFKKNMLEKYYILKFHLITLDEMTYLHECCSGFTSMVAHLQNEVRFLSVCLASARAHFERRMTPRKISASRGPYALLVEDFDRTLGDIR